MDDLSPKCQVSEREIHCALFGGMKLWTSRLKLFMDERDIRTTDVDG
jgi:hypothetical protein